MSLKCGIKREHDAPSPRYGSVPVDGTFAGKSILANLDDMLDMYYEKMGWDRNTGEPLPETLSRLGIADEIKML